MKSPSGSDPELSTDSWDLPGAESYVLLHGLDARSIQPFKLALAELVTRKALRMVDVFEPAVFNRTRIVKVIAKGSAAPPKTASLLSVYRLFERAPEHVFADGTTGVELDELALLAQKHYRGLGLFTVREVMPALVARGYYAQAGRLLGVLGSARYVLTPAGEAARQELEARVATGRNEFSGWVTAEPSRARAFMQNVGPALLLMPFLYDDIAGLPPIDSSHGERTWLMDGAIGPVRDDDPESEKRHLEAESYFFPADSPINQWALDSIPAVSGALDASFSNAGYGDTGYAAAYSGWSGGGASGGGDGGGSGGDGGGGGGGGGD